MPIGHAPHGLFAAPLIGASRLSDMFASGNIHFVDGDAPRTGNGKSPDRAVTSITTAISNSIRGATIYVKPRTTEASAQTYYADNLTIPITKPGLSIIGAGNTTGASTGVQLKPSTVTAHLITVNGAGLRLENMRLTLTGGTADVDKCIINAVRDVAATRVVADLVVRHCRIENDKSHPSYSGTNAVAAIGLGSANYVVIEDNVFSQCLGSIVSQETNGTTRDLTIRRNIFGGLPESRDADIWLSLSASYNINIVDNLFSDGVPTHGGGGVGRFIKIEGATATGLVANNFFASNEADAEWGTDGTECVIPATFFTVGNYSQLGEIVGGT